MNNNSKLYRYQRSDDPDDMIGYSETNHDQDLPSLTLSLCLLFSLVYLPTLYVILFIKYLIIHRQRAYKTNTVGFGKGISQDRVLSGK